jgi:hypothetical protein
MPRALKFALCDTFDGLAANSSIAPLLLTSLTNTLSPLPQYLHYTPSVVPAIPIRFDTLPILIMLSSRVLPSFASCLYIRGLKAKRRALGTQKVLAHCHDSIKHSYQTFFCCPGTLNRAQATINPSDTH